MRARCLQGLDAGLSTTQNAEDVAVLLDYHKGLSPYSLEQPIPALEIRNFSRTGSREHDRRQILPLILEIPKPAGKLCELGRRAAQGSAPPPVTISPQAYT